MMIKKSSRSILSICFTVALILLLAFPMRVFADDDGGSCGNGATNYPDCTEFPSCGNGATNYPACTEFPSCGNGATNYPDCTEFPSCGNGATNYPDCTEFPSCGNGATNYPDCTEFPSCGNGATNYPDCTEFPPCSNGATDPPACTEFPPCPTGKSRDAAGVCQWDPCEADQTRDAEGVCQWDPCEAGKSRDAEGVCKWDPCPAGKSRDAEGVCQWDSCEAGQTRNDDGSCVDSCEWDDSLTFDDPACMPPTGNKITICHVPAGNPGNAHTISISENAWGGACGNGNNGPHGPGCHGGDYLGACVPPSPTVCFDQKANNFGQVGECTYNKITICHVPAGNPGNAHTISISVNAWGGACGNGNNGPHGPGCHGGDYLGACISPGQCPTACGLGASQVPNGHGGYKTCPATAACPIPIPPLVPPALLIPVTGGKDLITAGIGHTCAATPLTGLRCWGENDSGQLGDGKTANSPVPMRVLGLDGRDVIQLVSGTKHTCALTISGEVMCWGLNFSGQLGNGNNINSNVPVKVVGLSGIIAFISAGENFTCATDTANTTMCWGNNSAGQFQNGNSDNSNTPVLAGLGTNVKMISGGQNELQGVLTGGALQFWSNLPTIPVTGLPGNVILVSADRFTDGGCAMTSDGLVNCWGAIQGSNISGGQPTALPLVTGEGHGCMVTDKGLMCWGTNGSGQLGNGTQAGSDQPVLVTGIHGVIDLAAGFRHTCAIVSEEEIKCWGQNTYGQLGNGTTKDSSFPVKVR